MSRAPAAHPANEALAPLFPNWPRAGWPELAHPDDVALPRGWHLNLGTHPDLVEHLWTKLGADLPEDCRYVYRAGPVLLRPDSGLVFAIAGGTSTLALRLPSAERIAALADGGKRLLKYPSTTLDLEKVGPEWVFTLWLKREVEWTRAAYEFAAPAKADPSH
jgi:hypothetical protein